MKSDAGQVWQIGVVLETSAERVRIRFQPLSHCQRCLSGQGCGAGVFGRLFARRGAELEVPRQPGLVAGQSVRVGIPERVLLRMALWLYGLPLLAFILAAGLAGSLPSYGWTQDVLAVSFGLAAAALAVVVAGRRRGRLNPTVELLSASAGCGALESGRT